jgi:hypothetical protein
MGSRPLTELEIQAIITTFSGEYERRNRTLFLLGLSTGARISELLSLNVKDVWRYNRPGDMIDLQTGYIKRKFQGRQITLRAGAPKEIRGFLRWKQKEKESLAKDAPLFVSRQNERLSRKQAHNILKAAFDTCKLSGIVTTHSLRRTFANQFLRDSGGDMSMLQDFLACRHLVLSPCDIKHVYFLSDGNGLVKIGKTTNLDDRVKLFKRANLHSRLIHAIPVTNYTLAEKLLHKHYHDYHVIGEWFKLPTEEIIRIEEGCYPDIINNYLE